MHKTKPKDYYYSLFKEHLQKFLKSLDEKGSSTNRCTFQNKGHICFSPDEFGLYQGRDHFETIPKEFHSSFIFCMTYIILIDQVMITHFNSDYEEFKKITLYPKLHNFSGRNTNPWFIPQFYIMQRDLNASVLEKEFLEFANFFTEDLKSFFNTQGYKTATWDNVKKAMINDIDVHYGPFGGIFFKELIK